MGSTSGLRVRASEGTLNARTLCLPSAQFARHSVQLFELGLGHLNRRGLQRVELE